MKKQLVASLAAAMVLGVAGTSFAAEKAAGTGNSVTNEALQDMSGKTAQDAAGKGTSGGPDGQAPGGGNSAVTEWTATKDFSSDTTENNKSYESTGTDENAIHVSEGATLF